MDKNNKYDLESRYVTVLMSLEDAMKRSYELSPAKRESIERGLIRAHDLVYGLLEDSVYSTEKDSRRDSLMEGALKAEDVTIRLLK